jgi:hypothetical protein
MQVLIIGFEDYDLMRAEIRKFMQKQDIAVFTVICGSNRPRMLPIGSLAETWAVEVGAPLVYIFDEDNEKLMNKLVKETDFIIAYYNGNNFISRLIMKIKAAGKHGQIVRPE